jgi:flagellar hook assembly protein FlgD
MALMDLTEEQETAFRVALYGQAGMAALPGAVTLSQNYPNPFNPATVIGFTVPREGASRRVSIKVYDIRGSLVRVLVDGIKEPGSHTVYWDGTDKNGRRVSSGIYLYRLKADGAVFTRKMVVVN